MWGAKLQQKLVEQAVLKRIQYYQVIVSNDNVKSSKADVLSVSPSSERTGNCAKAVASSRRRAEKKKTSTLRLQVRLQVRLTLALARLKEAKEVSPVQQTNESSARNYFS